MSGSGHHGRIGHYAQTALPLILRLSKEERSTALGDAGHLEII